MIVKEHGFIWECHNDTDLWRVKTMMAKEEETIRWLNTLTSEDVLFDIGANIGIYSLYASRKAKQVVAFEPNTVTAATLIRNIVANKLQNINVITCPIHIFGDMSRFNYNSIDSGSSGGQFGHTRDEKGEDFTPVFFEYKQSKSLDIIVRDIEIIPTHVKIDVDGNELLILKGMSELLKETNLNIQIEIHPNTYQEIDKYLLSYGYKLQERHHTANGKKSGKDFSEIPHNAIYTKT